MGVYGGLSVQDNKWTKGHVPAGRHCAQRKQRAMCQQGDIAKNVALCLHVAGRHCISSHGIRPIKSQDSYLRCKIMQCHPLIKFKVRLGCDIFCKVTLEPHFEKKL